MEKMTKTLNKIELVAASIIIFAGGLLYEFASKGISLLVISLLMFAFTILLIVFRKHHVYYMQNKPLLTAISIYYKSFAYLSFIFSMCHFAGERTMSGFAMLFMTIYMGLAYFNRKQYSEMLNAYLYIVIVSFARVSLFS